MPIPDDIEHNEEAEHIHGLQDSAIQLLSAINDSQLRSAKLCGGTALERLWLHHRLSYDLDFFLPEGFSAVDLSKALKAAGLKFKVSDLVDDKEIASQLHTFLHFPMGDLKISFIEDAYYELFPAISLPLGDGRILSEPVEGLYHRKLRTVSGSAAEGDAVVGGRQQARDLFDLYVLSKVHQPILEFMRSLPYEFPVDAFNNGLVSMTWFDLQGDLAEIVCAKRWEPAKDVSHLMTHLYAEIGAEDVKDEDNDSNPDSYPKERG